MSLLIATDEAGYGPRLGPLVVVATAWQVAPATAITAAHDRLAEPVVIEPLGELRVDDSKRVFQRKAATSKAVSSTVRGGLPAPLHLLCDAAADWISAPPPSEDLGGWLQQIAPADVTGLSQQPWFAELGPRRNPPCQQAAAARQRLIAHWSAGELQLVGISARVIDAARFNQWLDRFGNKAELLSHTTCALAVDLWRRHALLATSSCDIYSDRHGGRAFYGGLLQHHCPERTLQVIAETSRCSEYRLAGSDTAPGETCKSGEPCGPLRWRFTVSGDRYPPVALSSIIAKSIREQLMDRFNRYFQAAASASPAAAGPLRPTAGYAVDAARFLEDTAAIRAALSLSDARLIRRK